MAYICGTVKTTLLYHIPRYAYASRGKNDRHVMLGIFEKSLPQF